MTNELLIEARLPSLNEYTKACRSHWSKGAEFKKSVESLIGWSIKRAITKGELKAVDKPCEVYIYWHEATRRRDCDNIHSSVKFILDALQHFNIIKDDSRKYVKQIHHKVIDDTMDYVVVRLIESEEKRK